MYLLLSNITSIESYVMPVGLSTILHKLAKIIYFTGHLPSIKHEELTRKIENGINEMWYFIASVVKKEGNTMEPNKTYTTNEEDMSALDRISEEYTYVSYVFTIAGL